jgi:hypothetical protein
MRPESLRILRPLPFLPFRIYMQITTNWRRRTASLYYCNKLLLCSTYKFVTMISLRSTRGQFKPVPGVDLSSVKGSSNSVEKQLNVKGPSRSSHSPGVLEPSHRSRLVAPGRIVGSIVPRVAQVNIEANCWCRLLKKPLQVTVNCIACKWSK